MNVEVVPPVCTHDTFGKEGMKLGAPIPVLICILLIALLNQLVAQENSAIPTIEFDVLPYTEKGGTEETSLIQGRDIRGRPDQLIVLIPKS
mgnify:FL=1